MKKRILLVLMVAMMIMLLTGCMPGDGSYVGEHEANFLSGIWHGWIAPVSLIRGLFNSDIRIYEIYNSGWWYDFGFYMALVGGFGSLSLFHNKSKKKDS